MTEILRKDTINEAFITFCGQKARVKCDRKCSKAWGVQNRPKQQLSEDIDDTVSFADYELGNAPDDPRTYEGGVGKPVSPDEFPTKWCVRECERCAMSHPNEWMNELELEDFGSRRYNKPSLHNENLVLQHALKSLWRNYQYNQEYISFLLGSYSQEEFMKIAREYAKSHQETISEDELLFARELLSSLLGRKLCSTELSLFLNVDYLA